MELKIGPYRRVYEAHLKHFRSCDYPEIDATASPRSIIAQPLPEVALSGASAYLEAIVPSAVMLLAWDSYKGRHIKGRQPVDANYDLFVEDNATDKPLLIVNGVNPVLVVLQVRDNGTRYAAELAFIFQRED